MTKPAHVIALDLSSRTGFAFWDGPGSAEPEWGFWDLPAYADNPSRQLGKMRNALEDLIEARGNATHLIVEFRPPPGAGFAGRTNAVTGDQQAQLEAIARLVAFDWDLELLTPHPATVRSVVMGPGFGRMAKKDKEGGAIVRWLQARGYAVFDHNAADALLMALWFFAKDAPRARKKR